MDVSGFHHLRAKPSELFADQKNPVIGIENFWTQAKRHLHRFNGIQPANFYWFLNECHCASMVKATNSFSSSLNTRINHPSIGP